MSEKIITHFDIDCVKRLLHFIGDDPQREGLKDTPVRFLKAWRNHWGVGYDETKKPNLKTFSDGCVPDQMIVVEDIYVFSHCEHHIAPFYGRATVAYIPDKCIIGLSKVNRLVKWICSRLQVQERITKEIAEELDVALNPKGVAVSLECVHTCVCSRGVEDTQSKTRTTHLLGVFRNNLDAKKEFLSYLR